MSTCDHEYDYNNYVIECHLCGSCWDISDFIEIASRVPSLEKDREEWKIRAADLSQTISEMKIGIEGLFGIIRECLPYVHDMVGIASSARILEQEIIELLHGDKSQEQESGLTKRVPDKCPRCHGFCHVSGEGTVVMVCPACNGTGIRR